MIKIRFPDKENDLRALGYFPRFACTRHKRTMVVTEAALVALASRGVRFSVEGPVTEAQRPVETTSESDRITLSGVFKDIPDYGPDYFTKLKRTWRRPGRINHRKP